MQAVATRNINDPDPNLESFWIRRKIPNSGKNTVPYLNFKPELLSHSRFFVIDDILNALNMSFKGLLKVAFVGHNVNFYDECKTDALARRLISRYLSGRNLAFFDPFSTEGSKDFIRQIEEHVRLTVGSDISFDPESPADGIIALCKDIENDDSGSYIQSVGKVPVQHIEFPSDIGGLAVAVRRVLLDLAVKIMNCSMSMDPEMSPCIAGWWFSQFKHSDLGLIGSMLSVDSGKMNFQDFGFGLGCWTSNVPQEIITADYLIRSRYNNVEDCRVLGKDGNVYAIIDTDEIPILSCRAIERQVDALIEAGARSFSPLRNNDYVFSNFSGYIGLNFWRMDPAGISPYPVFAYIAGFNKNLKITKSTKFDKMPHVRHIEVVSASRPDDIPNEINEISEMLKFGYGRWGEVMTYPFPFKHLYEHLEHTALTAPDPKHWDEIE